MSAKTASSRCSPPTATRISAATTSPRQRSVPSVESTNSSFGPPARRSAQTPWCSLARAVDAFPQLEIELHHEISGVAFDLVRNGELDELEPGTHQILFNRWREILAEVAKRDGKQIKTPASEQGDKGVELTAREQGEYNICRGINTLVRNIEDLPRILHEAFYIASSGRPGPVVIDIPKDVQFAESTYTPMEKARVGHYQPRVKGDIDQITRLVELMETAERPVFYTGGGVINSGPAASQLLREFVEATGIPFLTTQLGKGVIDECHEMFVGCAALSAAIPAVFALTLASRAPSALLDTGSRVSPG